MGDGDGEAGHGSSPDSVVVYRPDGTRLQIATPPGITAQASVEGDLLFTTTVASQEFREADKDQPDPRPVAIERPVRWNLRTGQVEIFDNLLGITETSGNSRGWFVAGAGATGSLVLVAPGQSARSLTASPPLKWISADGSRVIGQAPTGIETWNCR
jgi:hypothetical protein